MSVVPQVRRVHDCAMELARSHDLTPMAPNRFPPPAAAGFLKTPRLIARVSAAAESFWRQRPRGPMAATWVALAVALALSVAFGPPVMPPEMPTLVQMAEDGEVHVPFHRVAHDSDQHALDAPAVGAPDVVGHPPLTQ